jgi:hypothetical protein
MKLPQFVPILTAFTSRVSGLETHELLQSPAVLARALADTQTVVGHDGVLNLYEPGLLFSACVGGHHEMNSAGDASGMTLTPPDEILQTAPLVTVLESMEPLRHHLSGRAKVIATFSGPELLYSQLQDTFDASGMSGGSDSDYILDVILAVVRSALELKVDGIALIEQSVSGVPSELQRCHKRVRKLADFYDASFLEFRLQGSEAQDLASSAHCVFDLPAVVKGIGPLSGRLGQSLIAPPPLTTVCDVPGNTQIENLKALSQTRPAA